MSSRHNKIYFQSLSIFPLLLLPMATQAANIDGCVLRIPSPEHSELVTSAPVASLYARLGGYDAIASVVDDLVQRLASDTVLGRFWAHRGADGIRHERQLIINFIVDRTGGPLYYSGREMTLAHKGMKITENDWKLFMGHLRATLEKFKVAGQEKTEVVAFMDSLKSTMVEY